MTVKRIIQEAINESPLGLKEALEEELRNRVRLALEAKMEDDEDEEDDDEDEEEDDEDEEEDMKKESVEQIDEISKKTLASYVQKSIGDVRNYGAARARGREDADTIRKAKNREAGIRLATDKIVGDTTWDYHKSGKKSDEYTMKPKEREASLKAKRAPAAVLNKKK